MAWFAAAAHEMPQELGAFGVLIHSGWAKRKALIFNVLSALTFLVEGLFADVMSFSADISLLIPLAVGNFIYIGTSDLVPEIRQHENLLINIVNFVAFIVGLALMFFVRIVLKP